MIKYLLDKSKSGFEFRPFVLKGGRLALDLIAPPTCPITGERLSKPGLLSPAGWAKLNFIADPICSLCGIPFEVTQTLEPNVICGACAAQRPSFDTARSVVAYTDVSRKIILSFKSGDRTELASMYADWLAQIIPSSLQGKSFHITAPPLHWRRLWSRRYNQSALIAKYLSASKYCENSVFAPDLLIRKRPTVPQKDLTFEGRWRNVSGAFAANEKRTEMISGASVLLIDDVFTSGATLSECARVLKRAGAAEVHALTIARVVKSGAIAI
ncbi:MAG: ComF family protein [Pseudomonadota bacterium]